MFKLFEDKSVLSATRVLFRLGYPDKKIIDYFGYYDIKTTKEIFNRQPTKKNDGKDSIRCL